METNELLSKPENYYASIRNEMLAFVPEQIKTHLDVGCGTGNFAHAVKIKTNAEVWGLEINEKIKEIASSKLDKVIIGDFFAQFELLPKNYFDCITFTDVLEHLDYPVIALEKTKELLTDNGKVVSSIPNVRYIRNLKELLFDKDWRYRIEGILDYTHLRFFTKKSTIRMFNDSGYDVIQIEGINPTRKKNLIKFLNIFLFGLLSDTIYLQFAVVAQIKKTQS